MALDWVTAGVVVTALATVGLVLFTALLWRVNEKLAGLQAWAQERDSASVAVHVLEVKPDTPRFPSSVHFLIENGGLRHTHIRKAVLEHDGPDGRVEVPLTFIWNKPDYVDHVYGNERITIRTPFHFVGERLESGQLWDVEAYVAPRVDIPSLPRPRLIVESVLGGRYEIDLVMSSKGGLQALQDSHVSSASEGKA